MGILCFKNPEHNPKLVYYFDNKVVVETLGKESNDVGQCIAKLGEEGWKMSGCANLTEHTHVIYFKKQK